VSKYFSSSKTKQMRKNIRLLHFL